MHSNRPTPAEKSIEACLDDVQMSRADREAAIRQLQIADGVATAIVRGIDFLRGLSPTPR
jgi:hypothetical protein